MEKIDPYTGETFIPQRSNQRFASRKNQIGFNNQKAQNKRKAKFEVDQLLDNNRSILKRILGDQEEVIRSRDFLLGAGFHFGCHTHNVKIEDRMLRCVYEYAIEKVGEKFKILKHA